jgi:hypothetical protein
MSHAKSPYVNGRKQFRTVDAESMAWLIWQGWTETFNPETHTYQIAHADGRATAHYPHIRDAIAEVQQFDPDILSRARKRAVVQAMTAKKDTP